VAPCPHQRDCPMAGESQSADWCHFAVRLPRTALHRQLKGGSLSYEDEKFSYLVATAGSGSTAANRVVRHPLTRKGLMQLRLCTGDGEVSGVVVSKRQGPLYRAARSAEWGDAWPPPAEETEAES
jgi:ribosomal protein RSM22 (predicted rRNA methylase)